MVAYKREKYLKELLTKADPYNNINKVDNETDSLFFYIARLDIWWMKKQLLSSWKLLKLSIIVNFDILFVWQCSNVGGNSFTVKNHHFWKKNVKHALKTLALITTDTLMNIWKCDWLVLNTILCATTKLFDASLACW